MKLKHLFTLTMFLLVGMLCLSSVNAYTLNTNIINDTDIQDYYNLSNVNMSFNFSYETYTGITEVSIYGYSTSSQAGPVTSTGTAEVDGIITTLYWNTYYSATSRSVNAKIYSNNILIANKTVSTADNTPTITLTESDYLYPFRIGDNITTIITDGQKIGYNVEHNFDGSLFNIISKNIRHTYKEIETLPLPANTNYSLGYSLTTLFDFVNQVSKNDTNLTIVNDTITLSNDYDDGLVAKYDLTNDFLDTSYNDNDGTGYGGVTANGTETPFDGVDDYVSVTDDDSLDLNNNFAISVWIYKNSNISYAPIIAKSSGNTGDLSYVLRFWDNGKLQFRVNDGSLKDIYSSSALNNNQWYFVTITSNNKKIDMYIDNLFINTITYTNNLINQNKNLFIGYDFNYAGTRNFNGSIRDVRIYDRALSTTEISNLYNEQKNYYEQGAITKIINLSAYDNKNYCQIKADSINTTGGSVLFYADGTQRYLNQIFAHDTTDDIEVMTKLLRGSATTTPSVTNVKIICGESPDNLSYIECGTNTTSCNVSYIGLSDGEKELNLFVTDSTGEYNYTYNFTVDTIAPAVTQITENSTTYKFVYDWFFTTTELNPDTCFYSLDNGTQKACTLELYFASEGLHTIDLTLTDLAGNTFTGSYNLTIDVDYAFLELNSYTLNVTDICLNTSTCYYIDTNTTFNATLTPSYNFTSSGEKYFTRYYQNDTLAENLTIWCNPIIYFRIYDNVRGLYVEDYTLNGDSDTAGVVQYLVYGEGLGSNSYDFSALGYSNETFYYTFTTSMPINITFNVTPVTITIKVYDEDNASNQLTFDLLMINSTTSLNYTGQVNFSAYYNETLTGDLKLVISSTGYASRSLYIELTPYTSASHTIYLMSDNSSYPVVFRTLEVSATTAIEDAVLNFYKYIDGTRTFLAQAKTDSQGYTYFNMDYLSGDYEIIITKDGYVTQELTSIPGVQEYTILMPETNAILNYLFDGFSYKFYPLKSSQYSFPFNGSVSVIDEDNAISSVIFTITSDNFSAQNTSTNANGAFLTIPILNESARYLFNLTVYRNGEKLTFLKYYDYKAESNYTSALPNAAVGMLSEDYNGERIMLMIIGYIIFAAVGSMVGGGVIGSVTGIFSLIIYFGMGWLSVGPLAVFGVFTLLGGFFLRD